MTNHLGTSPYGDSHALRSQHPRRPATTAAAPDEDRAYRMVRPYVSRYEHEQVAAERDALRAEITRLEWAICHLLMRDGSRHGGRVAVPLLALAVTDGAA